MSTPVWQSGLHNNLDCFASVIHHLIAVLQVKFNDHMKGKSHAKEEAKKRKTDNSVEASSSQSSGSASLSAQPQEIPSAQPLASTSALQAAIRDAELRCNVCQVQCTSKVLNQDFLINYTFLL